MEDYKVGDLSAIISGSSSAVKKPKLKKTKNKPKGSSLKESESETNFNSKLTTCAKSNLNSLNDGKPLLIKRKKTKIDSSSSLKTLGINSFDCNTSPLLKKKKKKKKKLSIISKENSSPSKKHPTKTSIDEKNKNGTADNSLLDQVVPSVPRKKLKQSKLSIAKSKSFCDEEDLINDDNNKLEVHETIDTIQKNFAMPDDPKHLVMSEKKPDKRKSKKMIKIEKRLMKSLGTRHPDDEKRTIFVGNVDCKLKRKSVEKFFRQYGEIESVRIRGIAAAEITMSKKEAITTGKLHDKRDTFFAYLRFKEESSVEKALQANGSILSGRHLRVDRSIQTKHEKNSIFVGNLCFEIENEKLHDFFKDCGKVTNVRIVRSNDTGASKGIGFVSFESREAVDLALEKDGKIFYRRPLRVKRTAKKEKVKKVPNWGILPPKNKRNNLSYMKHDKPESIKNKSKSMEQKKLSFAGDKISEKGKLIKDKKPGLNKTERAHLMNAKILASAGFTGKPQNKRLLFTED